MAEVTRRHVLAGAAALAAAPRVARAAGEPVRIGLITPLSGPGQLYGTYILNGAQIAVERLNAAGGVGGRPLELAIRDDKSTADASVAAYRELAGDGVRLFAQGPLGASLLATLPLLAANDSTLLMVGSSTPALTHEAFTPNAFRLGFPSPMAYGGFAALMARKYPAVTKWSIMMTDTASLREIAGNFIAGLKREYPKYTKAELVIAEPQYASFGATDYKNQISALMSSDSDGLFNILQGSDAITYYKQARMFDFEQKFKAIADSGNELAIAKAMGRNTPKNIWGFSGWYYGANRDNPVSQAVYKRYVEMTKDEYCNWFVGIAHDCIVTLAAGLQAAGSTEGKAMRQAIEAGAPDGATGRLVFRQEDHQFIGNLVFLNFGADAASPKGWTMFEALSVPGADYVEPPTPGRKMG